MTDEIKKTTAAKEAQETKQEVKKCAVEKADEKQLAENKPVRKTYSDSHSRMTTIKDKNHAVSIMVSSSEPEQLDYMMKSAEESVFGKGSWKGSFSSMDSGAAELPEETKKDVSDDKSLAVKDDSNMPAMFRDFSDLTDIRKEMDSFSKMFDDEMARMMPSFMKQTMRLNSMMDRLLSQRDSFFDF